jgi:hypothetical protein
VVYKNLDMLGVFVESRFKITCVLFDVGNLGVVYLWFEFRRSGLDQKIIRVSGLWGFWVFEDRLGWELVNC